MKAKHIISFILFLTLLCSCTGMSESRALKIAANTPGFNENLYRFLITGERWCLSDSKYVNLGNNHVRVDNIDVHTPNFETNFCMSEWMDINNNQVVLDFSDVGMQLNKIPYRCDGCIECYQKYAEEGLITLDVIDANKGGMTQRVSVSLTEKGKTFLLDMQDKDSQHEFLGESGVGVKMAQKVYTSAKEISKDKDKARYLFEYYVEYTPWSEALGCTTDKSKIHRERVSFEKQGGDWKIIQKEDAGGSENTRKF